MIILSAYNVKKYYSDNLILDNISFAVDETDRIGLVGSNGCGKTTLFNIITGKTDCDEGSISISKGIIPGVMEQFPVNDNKSVLEEALTVFSPLMALEKEIEHVTSIIDSGNCDIDKEILHLNLITEKFNSEGGNTYRNRTRSALIGLGFSEEQLQGNTSALSGGQRSKIQLAKLLLSNSKLLLLDEPTNHLDIESTQWLENFLRKYNGSFIVISHDRYFLDRVCNKTYHIENSHLTCYNCTYSEFTVKKDEDREIALRHYTNTMNEIHRIERIVEQQRRWNRERNIRTAESQLKRIERLEKDLEKPDSIEKKINFKFDIDETGGNEVLTVDNLSFSYAAKEIFKDISLNIKKGEKVFLIGPNGCGKTSLFKVLTGKLMCSSGFFSMGSLVQPGYYDQTQADLNPANSAFDEISNAYPKLTDTHIRSALAMFLFRGDDVFKKISSLSGGERARIALLKLMLSRNNFLLLDEPTNHLDINSREMLEKALENYDGTLFVISHDRYFINKLADRIYHLNQGKLTEFKGNYDYFSERHLPDSETDENKRVKPVVQNEYRLKKEQKSAERKRNTLLLRTEQKIAELEGLISEHTVRLNTPDVMSDYSEIISISSTIEKLQHELDDAYVLWTELSD